MKEPLMRILLALSILFVSGCLNARHSGSAHHAFTQQVHSSAEASAESAIEHVSAFNKVARFDGEGLIFTLEATEVTEDQQRRGLILQKKNQISHYFSAGFCVSTLNNFSGITDSRASLVRPLPFPSANRRHLLCRVLQI